MGEPVKLYKDGNEITLHANSQVADAIADGWVSDAPEVAETPEGGGVSLLPLDLPAYDILTMAGFITVEAVLAHEDLTDIDGVGEKTAGKIVAQLAEYMGIDTNLDAD